MKQLNIYKVWTHACGEEAVEAAEFAVINDQELVFYGSQGDRIAAFSSGSWVSVKQIKKES